MMFLARPVAPCPTWSGADCIWDYLKVKHARPHHGKRLLAVLPGDAARPAAAVAADTDRRFLQWLTAQRKPVNRLGTGGAGYAFARRQKGPKNRSWDSTGQARSAAWQQMI